MRGEIRQTNGRPWPQTEYQAQTDNNKNDNRQNLDKRKPVLELTEASHLKRIQRGQSDRNPYHPDPLRNRGKPKRKIDGHGRHFRANRYDLNQCVRSANGESCPRAEIRPSINPKKPREGMYDRHFDKRVSNYESDDSAEKV